MQPVHINRNSWHYKLIKNHGDGFFDDEIGDFCTYTRLVTKVIFQMVVFTVVAGIVAGITVGDLLVWALVCIQQGMWIPPNEGPVIFIAAAGGLTALFAFLVLKEKYDEYKYKHRDDPAPLIIQAYRSWKDKYCMKVEFYDAH